MNNSLGRLIDGMIATLRREIIPHVDGEFARGQAIGMIYMLNCLRLRASWSNAFLAQQLSALEDVSRELEAALVDFPAAPAPHVRAPAELPTAAQLEAMRDEGDRKLCELIDFLAERGIGMAPEVVARVEAAISGYLHRQMKWERATSAKPMFTEISRGSE